jgi:hypothetical protein
VNKIKTESALGTEASVIGTDILNTGNPGNLIIVDMEIELATHTTIGAGGLDLFFLWVQKSFMEVVYRDQGTYRASLDTFPTKDTIRIFKGSIPFGHNLGFIPPVSETDGIVHLDFITSLYASSAKNTTGEITQDEWIDILKGILALQGLEVCRFDLKLYGQGLQAAFTINGADILVFIPIHALQLKVGPRIHVHLLNQAIVIPRGEQQFQIKPAGIQDAGRLCLDHHFWGYRSCTGGDQIPGPFHLNQADPAGPCRRCTLKITKGGYLNPVSGGHLKDGLPRVKSKYFIIYSDCIFSAHSDSLNNQVFKNQRKNYPFL